MTTFYMIIKWLLSYSYLLTIILTIRILMKRRTTISSTISWLLIIYTLPIIGSIVYLIFIELLLEKKRYKYTHYISSAHKYWFKKFKEHKNFFTIKYTNTANSLFKLCNNRQGINGIKGNKLQLLNNCDKVIQSLIYDIKRAKHNIEMVFYIWYPGGLADEVAKSLMEASRRGVYCRLMLDSAGSIAFFRSSWVKIMRNARIDIVESLQVSLLRVFLRRIDIRQHRKIIIIDNTIAYTGSMNIVDPRSFKKKSGIGEWIDLMVRIKGPIVMVICIFYNCDWELETGKRILPLFNKINYVQFKKEKGHTVHIIASGPGFPKNIIHQALLTAVYSARKQLVITTPYFVPSNDLLQAICTVALRGVKVIIIVPYNNDSILVAWASRYFFCELLEAGVKIYQFQDGFLHTKSMVVDQQLSLIGTANLDMRSLWLNLEITLVIDDYNFSKNLDCLQNNYIIRSKLLDPAIWKKRSLWKRITERFFYFFSPLL